MSLQQATLRTCTHKSTIIKLPPMPVELQVLTSVFHNNKVYITGISTDHVPESRRVHVYSLEGNTWSTLPESNYNAPIAIINDHITLIGGRDAKTNVLTNIMSKWCEEEGEWRKIFPVMPTKRIASRAYQHGNLVLVTGGAEAVTEGEKGNVTDKVHVLNLSTKTWTTPQSLQLPRGLRSHYLIHFEEYIYLMGGALTFRSKQHHEKIHNANAWRARWSDIEEAAQQNAGMQHSQQGKSVWTPIVAPPTLRPTVVMFNNAIMSVGGIGISDGQSKDSIYKLVNHDTDSPLWVKVGSMSVGRYRHAVAPLGNLGAALFVAGGFVWVENEEDILKSASVELVLL